MNPVKFAILGAGSIAHKMAATVTEMDCVTPYCIASRDLSRAQSFAEQYGFTKAYGSYKEMLADSDVELVYIATPHSHHAQNVTQSLEAGKHVLCEKAFAVNADEAREMLALAKKKNLLLTEAIWPRYMPMAKTLREFCESGKIGRIHSMTCSLGYPVFHRERLHRPELAGGALLDIGIYPLTFASILFGDDIADISSSVVMSESGVDMQSTIILRYNDGKLATLFNTAISVSDRSGMICGDNGYAIVENINNFSCLKIFNKEYALLEEIPCPPQISGYEYEVESAVLAIREGRTECPEMPHSKTVAMMELMDGIRQSWALRYPME